MVHDPKSLGSTSVISKLWACVQACLVYSYFYQQHENHLSNRSEHRWFQACRRYIWRSGYLYKMSILWSNYWHWENLVIRNKWAFFVCKQIAFWFIRDAPLRTNYSRCCLCFQWLKGPTWTSYERVTVVFNPAPCWTGVPLAGLHPCRQRTVPGGLLLGVPLQASRSYHPEQSWTHSWLQLFLVPHVTTKLNPLVVQTGFALQDPSTQFSIKTSDGNSWQWRQKSLLQVSLYQQNPFSCNVHAHTHRLNLRKQTGILCLHLTWKISYLRPIYGGKFRTEDQRQSHDIICFKNVWVDKMAAF